MSFEATPSPLHGLHPKTEFLLYYARFILLFPGFLTSMLKSHQNTDFTPPDSPVSFSSPSLSFSILHPFPPGSCWLLAGALLSPSPQSVFTHYKINP